ncbi:MAG: family tricarboxylate transporter, receptor protein [Hyphomicrobiales bacterium]|nr:family tricarboxylate transporter, receptor protein [Hyphomicrobiales bacterium]
MNVTRRTTLAMLASSGLGATTAAAQQDWPNRPITLLVPFPPGPALDYVARQVGRKISETLGQSIVIENRIGANGAIAATAVARAKPDGYMLLAGTAGTHATAPHLSANLPYDPVKDFTPIIAAVEPVTCLAINASLPVKTVAELIAYLKARPGQLSYASSGVGSVFHLMGEMFNRTAGVQLNHLPYRGVEPAMNDVRANHVPMTFISISNALGAAESGEVRILAVLEPQRFSKQPDIPSMSELVPGFAKPSSWFGFLGPAGMDPAIVARLNAAMEQALNAPDLKPRLEELGLSVMGGPPKVFADLIETGVNVYGELIRQSVPNAKQQQ